MWHHFVLVLYLTVLLLALDEVVGYRGLRFRATVSTKRLWLLGCGQWPFRSTARGHCVVEYTNAEPDRQGNQCSQSEQRDDLYSALMT